MKQFKIGIYGSPADSDDVILKEKARLLGKSIVEHNGIVVTGGCPGLAQEVVLGAAKAGGAVVAFSPATSLEQHKKYGDPTEGITEFNFIPADYVYANNLYICMKYRNVSSVAFVDAAIILRGRIGTMNEFTIAYDIGKVIGVLEDTGGITRRAIKILLEDSNKQTDSIVFFESDPLKLVDTVFQKLSSAN